MLKKKIRTKETKVLFLGGYGRSGSTITDLLLSQVPGVAVLGEIRHLFSRVTIDDELCNCGTPLLDCSFWTKVLQTAFPDGYDQSDLDQAMRAINRLSALPQIIYPALRTKKMQRHLDLYTNAFAAVFGAFAEVSGATVIVDSSKYPLHGMALSTRPDLFDMSTMLLVRDARAVTSSWETPKIRPEIHWEKREMPKHNAVRSAVAWNLSNLLTHVIKRYGKPFKVLRYEDFVDSPLSELRDIISFAGGKEVDISEDIFAINKIQQYHKVAGNPLGLSGKRLEIKNDEKWKKRMSKSKQFLVKVICYRQMKKYNYL